MTELHHAVHTILALAPNWLGDAAMCTPALRALHTRFPQAQLTVAARPGVCKLLEDLPWIQHLIALPTRPGAWHMLQLGRQLHPHAHDLCVVFPHSFRAALQARLFRSRHILGYARGGRRLLLHQAVPPYREAGQITPIYMAREYLDLLAPLGCVDDNLGLELAAPQKDIEAVQHHLTGTGPVVAIAPGAAFGPSKCWLPERYAQVADQLTEKYQAQCVLLTGPGEEQTRDILLNTAKHPLINAYEEQSTIARLKAILSQCDLLIGNDSGPRHIAIAFKKPVICIMGSTSPRYTDSPWEQGQLLRVSVDCGPCQKTVCTTDHRCMTRISVDDVVQAASSWLDKAI